VGTDAEHRELIMAKLTPSKDWVAMIIAIGLATALNLITLAVLIYAFYNPNHVLSDNAVNLLTGWGGGMVGIVGAYVGYKAGRIDQDQTNNERDE
jgi:hypothetical protein